MNNQSGLPIPNLNLTTGSGTQVPVVSQSSPPPPTHPQHQQQQYVYYPGTGTVGTTTTANVSPVSIGLGGLGVGNRTGTRIMSNSGQEAIISSTGEIIGFNQLPYAEHNPGAGAGAPASTGQMLIYPTHEHQVSTTASGTYPIIEQLSSAGQIQYSENIPQYFQIPTDVSGLAGTSQQLAPLQTIDTIPTSGLIYSFNYSSTPEQAPITFTTSQATEGFEDLIQINPTQPPAPVAVSASTMDPMTQTHTQQFTISNGNQQEISVDDFNDLLRTLPLNSSLRIDEHGRVHLPPEDTTNSSSIGTSGTSGNETIILTGNSAASFSSPVTSPTTSFIKTSVGNLISNLPPETTIFQQSIPYPQPVAAVPVTSVIHNVPYSPPPPGAIVHTVPFAPITSSSSLSQPVPVIQTVPQPRGPPKTQITVTTVRPTSSKSIKPVRILPNIPLQAQAPSTSKYNISNDVEIIKTIPAPVQPQSQQITGINNPLKVGPTPTTYILMKQKNPAPVPVASTSTEIKKTYQVQDSPKLLIGTVPPPVSVNTITTTTPAITNQSISVPIQQVVQQQNPKPIQIQVPVAMIGGQVNVKGATNLQLVKPNQQPQFKTLVVLRGTTAKTPAPGAKSVFTLNNPRGPTIRVNTKGTTHQVYGKKSAPPPPVTSPTAPASIETNPTNAESTIPSTDFNKPEINGDGELVGVKVDVIKTKEEDNLTMNSNQDISNSKSKSPEPQPAQSVIRQTPVSEKKPRMNGNVKNSNKTALSNANQTPVAPPLPPRPQRLGPPIPKRESLVTWGDDGIGKLAETEFQFRVNPNSGTLEIMDYVLPPVPDRSVKITQDENIHPTDKSTKRVSKSKLPPKLKSKVKKYSVSTTYLNKIDRRSKMFRFMKKHNPIIGMVKTSTSTSVTAAAKLLHNATSGNKKATGGNGKPGGRKEKRRAPGGSGPPHDSETESESESDDDYEKKKKEKASESEFEMKEEPENSSKIEDLKTSPDDDIESLKKSEVIHEEPEKTDDESDDRIECCHTCGKFGLQVEFIDGKYCTKCKGPAKQQSPTKKKKSTNAVAVASSSSTSAPIVSIDVNPVTTSSVTVVPIFFKTKDEDEDKQDDGNTSDAAVVKKRRGRRKKNEIPTLVEELPPMPPTCKSRPTKKSEIEIKKPYGKRSFDRVLTVRKERYTKSLGKQPPSQSPTPSSGRSSSTDHKNVDDYEESSDDRDSSVERKVTKKGEFTWAHYLQDTNTKPAPARFFRQPAFPPANPFKPGKMLEAIDPQHQSLICVAQVVETQGYRVRLRLTGYSETFDFWVNADSLEIFPAGWCETHNFTLEPPPNIENFNWHKYLIDEQCYAADREWFSISKEENGLSSSSIASDIKIGMKLEAVDIRNQSMTCVATIAQVINDRILIHFDSWESSYDYWTDMSSPFIHPVGWCEKNKLELTPPKDFKGTFTWEKYLKETRSIPIPSQYFRPLPPINFKKGMKLECVDKRNPFLVRVATVADVEDHQLLIHFDGWPSTYDYKVYECAHDIHPVNWCESTGHPLQPPPCENEPWSGPCTVFGCLGLGHIKGPKFLTHNTEASCPYSSININKDLSSTLPDRLTSWKNSKRLLESKRAESIASSTNSSGRPMREKRKLSTAALDSGCSNSSTDVDLLLRKPPKLSRKSSSSIPELFPETDITPVNNEDPTKKTTTDKQEKASGIPEVEIEPEAPILSRPSPLVTPVRKNKGGRPRKHPIPKVIEDTKPEESFISTIQLPNIESTITASTCDPVPDRKHWDDIIESVVRRKSSTEERSDSQPDTPSSSFSLPPSTTMTPITASSSNPLVGSIPPAEDEKPDLILISSGQGPFEVTTKQLTEDIKSFTTVAGITISASPLNVTKSETFLDSIPSTMTMVTSGNSQGLMGFSGQSSSSTTTVTTVLVPLVSPEIVKSQPSSPQLIITPSAPTTSTSLLESDLPINYTVNVKPLQEIVKDTSVSRVSEWTTQDVVNFIERVPGCNYAAEQFESQKVDGEAFLMLNQIDLIEIMGFKMGPAIKLAHVLRLIHRNSN